MEGNNGGWNMSLNPQNLKIENIGIQKMKVSFHKRKIDENMCQDILGSKEPQNANDIENETPNPPPEPKPTSSEFSSKSLV